MDPSTRADVGEHDFGDPMNSIPARNLRRHRFSPEIVLAARSCCRADNWHGPLEAAEHWLWIAFWIAVSLAAWRGAPIAVAVPVYVVAVYFIGGRQRAIAGLLHQAVHNTLMSNPRAGVVVGTVFGGYPVLQSFTGYSSSHIVGHHAHTGQRERDPDYIQYCEYGICGPGLNRVSLRRHLRRLIMPASTWSYLVYLVRNRIAPRDEQRVERRLRLAFLVAVVVAVVAQGGAVIVLAYWLVPLVTTQVWIGAVAELLEHYPLVETAPRLDLELSWNRDYNMLERFLLGEKAGEGYHLVHHLFPRVPLWRLAEVDQILLQDPDYAALRRLHGICGALATIQDCVPPTSAAAP